MVTEVFERLVCPTCGVTICANFAGQEESRCDFCAGIVTPPQGMYRPPAAQPQREG